MGFAADRAPSPRWPALAAAAVALGALALPVWVVLDPPEISPPARVRALPTRVVPPAELPPVEPVAYQDLPADEARAWNARVPFSDAPNPAARPFRFDGTAEQRARAVDCMAAAMLYEAGDDPVGERAVGQVIINRARHPAFPKTICGVVFQGEERRTGCQFTFTCDGAIARAPNPEGWRRAQSLAEQALSGRVFAPVGHSTHYHTDWVVPYWSASLDKVAEVHTHLFFRWTGWWGTPPAFRRAVSSDEPVVPKLAAWSPPHSLAVALDDAAALMSNLTTTNAAADPAAGTTDTVILTLTPAVAPDALPALAQRTCGPRDYCKLMAWTDRRNTPTLLPPTDAQLATMAFSYLRDRARGFDKPLWNCTIFARSNARECMRSQIAPRPLADGAVGRLRVDEQYRSTPPAPASPTTTAPGAPEPLSGVRRAPRPGPTATATPRGTPPPATP